jgi:hypothetical protein
MHIVILCVCFQINPFDLHSEKILFYDLMHGMHPCSPVYALMLTAQINSERMQLCQHLCTCFQFFCRFHTTNLDQLVCGLS